MRMWPRSLLKIRRLKSTDMKLYDVPRGSYIILKEDTSVPPVHRELKEREVLKFHRIDGAYSYCVDSEGNTVHPAAWSEVEIVD